MAGSTNDPANDESTADQPADEPASRTIQTSGVRPRTPVERGPRSRLILFASREEACVSRFEETMPDGVRVLRLDDVFSLLESLRGRANDEDPTLIIDQRDALFRAQTVAALSSALPDGSQVLLWGISTEDLAEVEALSPNRHFHHATAEAEPEDLAWMCRPGTRSDLPPAPAVSRLLVLDDDVAYLALDLASPEHGRLRGSRRTRRALGPRPLPGWGLRGGARRPPHAGDGWAVLRVRAAALDG